MKFRLNRSSSASVGKAVLVGHSHVNAIKRALRKRTEFTRPDGCSFAVGAIQLRGEAFKPDIILEDGKYFVPEKTRANILAALQKEKPTQVVLTLLGNEHSAMALVRHPKPFDFGWPASGIEGGAPSSVKNVQMIGLDDLKHALRYRLKRMKTLAQLIVQDAGVPAFFLPPPPANPSEEHLRTHSGAFAERIDETGVTHKELRLKMWRLQVEVLRETAQELGAKFIDLPDFVFEDGYFAQKYWNPDPTHGNEDYGNVVIDLIGQTLPSQKA